MSKICIERADGDAFEDQAQADLLQEMLATEATEVIASEGTDGGWGHHSISAVILHKDKFYRLEASGCSCDGSASIAGPFDTPDEAGIGDQHLSEGDNMR